MSSNEEKTFHDSLFDLTKLKEGYKVGSLLAVDPQLLSKFMTHLSRTVKRDEVTKSMVFLTGVSSYTKNPINLFMRGPSSIGKSYNTTQTLRYFPEEDIWYLGGLSPTALVHDYGVLVDRNGEEIDFNEKPKKDATEEDKKRWREKLQHARYIVDLHHKILVFLEPPHIETYNKLRPILSHDKEEISYKFTDKEAKGRLRTAHVVIKGWPATVFCSTEERYVEDLATRGFTITPEMEPVKYQAAGMLTGEKKAHPRKFREDFDFTLLQGYFRWLPHQLESLNVAIPYAQKLAEYYPFIYARSMRDFDHLTTLIEISGLFHYAQRPVEVVHREEPIVETWREKGKPEGKVVMHEETRHKEDITILPSMKDLDYVLRLWRSAEETTVTGLPGHVLDFYHKAVEPLTQQMEKFSYEDLTQKYNEVSEQKKSSWAIRKWVKLLTDVGYLDTEPDPLDKRKALVKVIKKVENACNSWIPRFLDSFTLEDFKKWLDDEKKILETETIFLKENFAGELCALEPIYQKHFVSKIFPTPSEAEIEPKEEKKPESLGFQETQRIQRLSDGELIILLKARFGEEPFLQDEFEAEIMKHGPRSKEEAESLREHLLDEGSMFYTPEGWLKWI